MMTTIQLNNNVKKILSKMKNEKETYESVILNLISFFQDKKRKQKELLIEGCKEMYGDMIKVSNEWDTTLMDGINRNEK